MENTSLQKTKVETPIQSDIKKILPQINLFAEFEEFINFCATSRELREIKTQKDFANKYGVSEDTLTNWKKIPYFSERVREKILSREVDNLADVIEGLRMKAESGSPGATNLWLQYIGEINNKGQKDK